MSQPSEFDDGEPAETFATVSAPNRPQFRIWDIGLVMLAVGVLCAITRLLPWSETHVWFYLTYFGALALYMMLRVPPIVRAIRHDWRQMQARKARLLKEAEATRRR